MKRAVIYCRVSTDAQEQDGTSLDTQAAACRSFASALGYLIIGELRDTASGFSLDRPGMTRIRELIRSNSVDVVVSHALDRMSRKQTHVAILADEVEQYGVAMEFVTEQFEDTSVGQLIRSVKAFAAEFEREKILERTSRGKAERARSGRLPQGTGKGLYGYYYDPASKRRTVNDAQADVVRRIFEEYATHRSVSAVAQGLNRDSIPAMSGGRWYPLTVRRVLMNESYAGRTFYRRTRRTKVRRNGRQRSACVERPTEEWISIPNATPRIVEEQLWQRVQTILRDPERVRRKPQSRGYLLSGRIKCARCGAAVVGQALTGKTGTVYRYYRCRHVYDANSGRRCDSTYMRADDLERAVWAEVMAVLGRARTIVAQLRRSNSTDNVAAERARLEQKLNELSKREARLIDLYADAGDDSPQLRKRLVDAADERRHYLSRLAELPDAPSVNVDAAGVVEACRAIRERLRHADVEVRTLALEALQVEVRAAPGEVAIRGVLPAPSDAHVPFSRLAAA